MAFAGNKGLAKMAKTDASALCQMARHIPENVGYR
jgi:hypothetical protein